MKEELHIVYKIESGEAGVSGKVDPLFDDDLITLARVYGWRFWASSCNRETGERDLTFDRKEAGKLIRTPLVAFELDSFCEQEAGLYANCEEVADLPE